MSPPHGGAWSEEFFARIGRLVLAGRPPDGSVLAFVGDEPVTWKPGREVPSGVGL